MPLPEDRDAVTGALMNAVCFEKAASSSHSILAFMKMHSPLKHAGAMQKKVSAVPALGSLKMCSSPKRSRPNGNVGALCSAVRIRSDAL